MCIKFSLSSFDSETKMHLRTEFDLGVGPTCHFLFSFFSSLVYFSHRRSVQIKKTYFGKFMGALKKFTLDLNLAGAVGGLNLLFYA